MFLGFFKIFLNLEIPCPTNQRKYGKIVLKLSWDIQDFDWC